MQRHTFAALTLALAATAASPALLAAQDVPGSGIVPAAIGNSEERPIAFARSVPADAALAVVMTDAGLPEGVDGLPVDAQARIVAAEFAGKAGELLDLPSAAGSPRIVLFGAAGEDGQPIDWRVVGGRIAQELAEEDAPIAVVGLPGSDAMAMAGLGATLGQYRFDRYKSDRSARPSQPITFVGAQAAEAAASWTRRQSALADGVRFARDLVNEPASVIYPESFVARAQALFAGVPNVSISVLDQADMRRMNMGAIAGVGQGSRRPPRLMMIAYRGASGAPIALAGKGITFDTGGISIKPGPGMEDMKWDMGGAGAVAGAMLTLVSRKAQANVVGVMGLVENMPDGKAQRPGDVVTSMSGQTIEVLNTDAEGRLVLADALHWTQKEFQPERILDFATLTGAMIIALGNEFAGVFSNDDKLAKDLHEAGEVTGDRNWRMPIGPAYDKLINSPIADMKNIGGKAAGSITAAQFLQRFIENDTPWAHVDVAGMVWSDKPGRTWGKGATGYGVRLVDRFVRDTLEG